MNRFLTFPGQVPVYLGDIDFLQDAVKDSLLLLLRGLTGQDNPNCILIQPTAQRDGVICVEGEIMPYKHSSNSLNTHIAVKSSYAGERVLKSGETRQCHAVRYAIAITAISGSGTSLSQFSIFDELLAKKPWHRKLTENWSDESRYLYVSTIQSGRKSYCLEINAEQRSSLAAPTTVLFDQLLGPMPATMAGTYYTSVIIDNADALSVIPAKVVLEADQDRCKCKVTIPATTIAVGAKVSMSLFLFKD